jgi:hypothetical protein
VSGIGGAGGGSGHPGGKARRMDEEDEDEDEKGAQGGDSEAQTMLESYVIGMITNHKQLPLVRCTFVAIPHPKLTQLGVGQNLTSGCVVLLRTESTTCSKCLCKNHTHTVKVAALLLPHSPQSIPIRLPVLTVQVPPVAPVLCFMVWF